MKKLRRFDPEQEGMRVGVRQANSGVDSRCKSGGKEGVTVPIRLMQTPTTCRMLRRERGYAGVADRHRRLEWLWQLGDTRP